MLARDCGAQHGRRAELQASSQISAFLGNDGQMFRQERFLTYFQFRFTDSTGPSFTISAMLHHVA